MTELQTLIIGAGPAGLACAACLARKGEPYALVERSDHVGAAWRNHYERLHLHTDRARSGLPYMPMPRAYPKYPSRAQVVEYLEAYAERFGIRPAFGETVERIRQEPDGAWRVDTDRRGLRARTVVVATGYTRTPAIPEWSGRDSFEGELLHSGEYRNGAPFRGRDVLVVGFGNSAGEIALDLLEAGARPALSVRGEVCAVPRDLFGIPILALAIPLSVLPAPVADALSWPMLRVTVGNLERYGLRAAPHGPLTQIRDRARIPLLDVGTLDRIRSGDIEVMPAIDRLDQEAVIFADGSRRRFDAIVAATGFRPALGSLLAGCGDVLDGDGTPRVSGGPTAYPGLYFCGFHVAPTGMLREVGIEARRIADHIARHRSDATSEKVQA